MFKSALPAYVITSSCQPSTCCHRTQVLQVLLLVYHGLVVGDKHVTALVKTRRRLGMPTVLLLAYIDLVTSSALKCSCVY